MIWDNIDDFVKYVNSNSISNVLMTSGGFDPLHVGHVRCLLETALMKGDFENSVLVVIANGDEFLQNKKGFVFMPEKERMEILQSIKGVDHVVRWYDGTQTCVGAIEKIKPNVFTKGGDRSSRDKIPEANICDEVGCKIIYGVGGKEKVQSSSWLTKKEKHNRKET